MHRHQQRDLEAGGPGRGRLDTRKRGWKGPDGSVVEKRPRLGEPESPPPWTNPGLEPSAQVVSPPVSDEGRFSHEYQLGGLDDGDEGRGVDAIEPSSVEHHQSGSSYLPQVQAQYDDYRQPAAAISNSRPQPPPPPPATTQNGRLEYQPAFQPDTASSFNMPYTTALDYNWLFNLEAATTGFGFGLTSFGQAFQDQPSSLPMQEMAPRQSSNDMAAHRQVQQHPTPESQNNTNWHNLPEEHATAASNSPRRTVVAPPPSVASMSSTPSSRMTTQNPIRPQQDIDTTTHLRGHYQQAARHTYMTYHKPREPERPLSMLQIPAFLPQIDETTRERLLNVIEAANPAIPDQPLNAPIRDHPLLSPSTLQSWLDLYFTQFNTTYPLIHMPTFSPRQSEPLLLLSILLLGATYSDKGAHQVAVCIHDVIRPSIFAHAGFSPRPELWTLQTILLVECFGKSRAGQRQHDFSHLFHGLLINLIRRSDCQSVTKQPYPKDSDANDPVALDDTWKRWAESEQKKRLALLCFMWDVQHAVLFCQSLCMSAFELRCAMPCNQNIWEAPDAETWASNWRRSCSLSSSQQFPPAGSGPGSPTPMFLPTLKSYLAPGAGVPSAAGPGGSTNDNLDSLNALSLVLVLHGIMSIAWDMQRRDQTSLGVNSILASTPGPAQNGRPTTGTTWRDLLSDAYNRWKLDFDQYCADASTFSSSSSSLSSDGTAAAAAGPGEWAAFAAAYRSVYHAAQALLHMDFLDIQIYAGARHILGRPVQQQDYLRSSRVVKRWASSSGEKAAIAAWHAACMLCDVIVTAKNNNSNSNSNSSNSQLVGPSSTTVDSDAVIQTNLFHVPWCLYLATLTCWAFHHAKPSRGKIAGSSSRDRYEDEEDLYGDESDESDEIVWNPQKEMEALVRTMAGSGNAASAVKNVLFGQDRRGTNGLVWVVADLLSKVRWGIVHAGVVVLRGLVPTRLINQYEIV